MPVNTGVTLAGEVPRRTAVSRSRDREVTFGGLVLAAGFLGLAAASLLLPGASRLGAWVPLHLALAGGAATAIAAVLPFFSVALAAGRPVHPAVRIAGIALVAIGALAVIVLRDLALAGPVGALVAGGMFLAGLAFVAASAFMPLRAALGVRRPLVERAYAIGLANVALGVTLAILLLAGDRAVAQAWGWIKPAHAWLNLVGFAGLVIVATLVHLAPTVAGSRIQPRRSSRFAIVGIAIGAPVIALGYVAVAGTVVQAGALLVLAGAVGVVVHGIAVHADGARGRWTTDQAWHRLSMSMLLGGQVWLGVGLATAAVRALAFGDDPAGWSISLVAGPLVLGGVIQILIGAATHLIPAIGPGGPERHAAQRRILGRAGAARLVALNIGAGAVAAGAGRIGGSSDGGTSVVWLGLALAAAAVGGSLVVMALAALPLPRGIRPDVP
jgi:nitrite reductase (NO-forming)